MKKYDLSNLKDIKDLAYHIKRNLNNPEIKHTDILEALSKSLGFKNWNTLKAQQINIQKYSYINEDLLAFSNKEKIKKHIIQCMDVNCDNISEESAWNKKAYPLIDIGINIFFYKKDKQANGVLFELDIDNLKSCFYLENILKYKQTVLLIPEKENELINAYLSSILVDPLSVSNINQVSPVSIEQHGYILMQIIKNLN